MSIWSQQERRCEECSAMFFVTAAERQRKVYSCGKCQREKAETAPSSTSTIIAPHVLTVLEEIVSVDRRMRSGSVSKGHNQRSKLGLIIKNHGG